MTPPRRMRSVVPSDSGIRTERKPLIPEVEPILGGAGEQGANTESQAPAVPDSQTSGVSESRSTRGPRWKELVRKEARLHPGQVEALTALRRRINANRRNRSEIITDNSLLRVAVGLLMAHADRLRGDTEEELLASVLPRRRTGASQGGAGSEAAK